jgi:hypothetical protein
MRHLEGANPGTLTNGFQTVDFPGAILTVALGVNGGGKIVGDMKTRRH